MPVTHAWHALHVLLLLFIVNLTLQPLVEPDFGWHLRAGLDWLDQGGHLPETDPYSHTIPEWPWVEHAWLTDVVLALLYKGMGAAGGLGVMVFYAALTTGAFMIASTTVSASWTVRLMAMAGALWVGLPFLGARTQMVTLLGLALLLRCWQACVQGQRQMLWVIPGLFLVWANLHGGFVGGLVLLSLFGLGSLLMRVLVDWKPQWEKCLDEPVLEWRALIQVWAVLLVSCLVTLLNPYGFRLHAEIFSSLGDRLMIETLTEWLPVSWHSPAGATYLIYLAVLGVGLLAFMRRVEPVRWLVLLVFLMFSLRHWRNALVFLLLSAPLAAEIWAGLRDTIWQAIPARFQVAKAWSLGATVGVAILLVVLGADHLRSVVWCGVDPKRYFSTTEYPIEAVDWIQAHRSRLGSRMYNDYGFGGFLLWWNPADKIFIDGRMPAWRVGDRWIFRDYLALTSEQVPQLSVLETYQVDWAMVTLETPLEQALAKAPAWTRVYRDHKVSVYVKAMPQGEES
jgi:hypothetical protein